MSVADDWLKANGKLVGMSSRPRRVVADRNGRALARALEEKFVSMFQTKQRITIPAKLTVKGLPNLRLNELLIEFAKEFMEEIFIKEFVLPAYRATVENPRPYMPQYIGKKGPGRIDETSDLNSALNRRIAEIDSVIEKNSIHARNNQFKLRAEREELMQKYIKRRDRKMEREHRQQAVVRKADSGEMLALWRDGFKNMLNVMTEITGVKNAGGRITVSMGSITKLLAIPLSAYSVTGGEAGRPSELNSFFYAAEFGTGVAKNVGGRVRTEGHTKVAIHGQPGFWWYGHQSQNEWTGALFSGQMGTHFWFEAGTDTPNPKIHQYINEHLQSSLTQFLRTRQ